MTNREMYRTLWQRLHQSTSVDVVLEVLGGLDSFVHAGDLSVSDVYDLQADAFQALRELTKGEVDKAEPLILEYLLPYCLQRGEDAAPEARAAISRCRTTLAEWIHQYTEVEYTAMRDQALDRLHSSLGDPEPRGTCWTIAAIGFRRSDIVDALWELSEQHDDDVGDTALSTLVSLGVTPSHRRRTLSALHKRATSRCNIALLAALRQLADPESLSVVKKHWLEDNAVEGFPRHKSLALRVLADVADSADGEPDLQDCIWQAVSDLFESQPSEFTFDVHMGSDIGPRCDSVNVVPTLLRWLSNKDEASERAVYNRYLLCLRLEECVRPHQLQGWGHADEPQAVAILQRDAFHDTGHEGALPTQQTWCKETAWGILLRLGHDDALGWFEDGVAKETNPFLRRRISQWLACFHLDPLPPTVLRWVTEPYDREPNEPSGEWVSRFSAIQLARSAASWEAFEGLCKCGLTIRGKGLQEPGNALAEVAATLVRAGQRSVIDLLVEVAVQAEETHHRTTAAWALEHLASSGLLPAQCAAQISVQLADEDRDLYERSLLVATLGHLEVDLAPDTLRLLNTWALERDDWLGGRSLETLARRGNLLSQPRLLNKRLGLEEINEKWDLAPEADRFEWAAFITGLLYLEGPATFSPAIASLLRTGSWGEAVQVLHLLYYLHRGPNQPPLPAEIEQALIERTRQRQTFSTAETGVFLALAHLAPDTVAQERWENIWDDWLPDARAALADALGTAAYATSRASARAESLLHLLTGDGQYAVRRAAYRSLARQSPKSLQAVCFRWSEDAAVEHRQRAAEACAWLAPSAERPDAFEALYQRLVVDPEAVVRRTAQRVWQERRERLWAEEYLVRVRRVKGRTNEEILSVWPYAQALVRLGDDACIRELRTDLASSLLPPNVRHWLEQIVEGIDERWRKATQKWPEPWLTWEGAIEEGHGTATSPDGRTLQVRYSIWKQPSPIPSQSHSWGGAAWSMSSPYEVMPLVDTNFVMRLEDGREGAAMATNVSSSGPVIFLGQGPYPA